MDMQEMKEKIQEYIKTPIGKLILGVMIAVVIFIAVTFTYVVRLAGTVVPPTDVIEEAAETPPPVGIVLPTIPADVKYIVVDDIFVGSFEGEYWNSMKAYELTELAPTRQIEEEEINVAREYYEFGKVKLSVDKSPLLEATNVASPEEVEVYTQKIKEYLNSQYLGNTPIVIEQIERVGNDVLIVASSPFDIKVEDKATLDYGVFRGIFALSKEKLSALVFEGILANEIEFEEEEVIEEAAAEAAEESEEGAVEEAVVKKYTPKIDFSKFEFELVGIYDFNADNIIEVGIKRTHGNEFEVFVFTRRAEKYKLVLYNRTDKLFVVKKEEIQEEQPEGETEKPEETGTEEQPEVNKESPSEESVETPLEVNPEEQPEAAE